MLHLWTPSSGPSSTTEVHAKLFVAWGEGGNHAVIPDSPYSWHPRPEFEEVGSLSCLAWEKSEHFKGREVFILHPLPGSYLASSAGQDPLSASGADKFGRTDPSTTSHTCLPDNLPGVKNSQGRYVALGIVFVFPLVHKVQLGSYFQRHLPIPICIVINTFILSLWLSGLIRGWESFGGTPDG